MMANLDNRMRFLIGAVVLLAVGAAVIALRQDITNNVVGSDPGITAVSAVSKGALFALLEDLDLPVTVDRGRGGVPSKDSDDLRIVTGRSVTADNRIFLSTRLAGQHVLVVLPKWQVTEDPLRPEWVGDATGLEVDAVESMLRMVVTDGKIVRPSSIGPWSINELGFEPTFVQPQLFNSEQARPIVAGKDGMLIGEITYGSRRIWVLSDPDILANHGLYRGDNALLAFSMVEALKPDGGRVVFDLAVQANIEPLSIEQLLFSFPTAIVTIQTALVFLLLVWATAQSFGSRNDLPRPISSGSAALIANMSALLILGGHMRDMLARYGQAIMRDVAQRLHAPSDLDRAGLDRWLERIAKARGAGDSHTSLIRRLDHLTNHRTRPDARQTMALAADFHQWRQEMIRGPGHDRQRQ